MGPGFHHSTTGSSFGILSAIPPDPPHTPSPAPLQYENPQSPLRSIHFLLPHRPSQKNPIVSLSTVGATQCLLQKVQTKNALQTPTGCFIYNSLNGVSIKRSPFTTAVTGSVRVSAVAADFKPHQQLLSSEKDSWQVVQALWLQFLMSPNKPHTVQIHGCLQPNLLAMSF